MKNIKTGHSGPIVCLDAGHYGYYNRSPAVNTYYESKMTWKLHLLLKDELEKYGIEVKTTRLDQAADMGLTTRGKASNGCDLFLSIHSNAVGSGVNESIDYPIVYTPISGKGNEIGKLLADCIANTMGTKQAGRISSRKGNNGDYYGVIRGATAVDTIGLILEHSFHTNTTSTKWLLDDNNLAKLAKAEAAIIADYFGIIDKNNKLYRIRKSWTDAKSQIGAYANLDIAKNECPDDYIVYDFNGNPVYTKYTLKQFIQDMMETVMPTINRKENNKHAIVPFIQRRLIALGYNPGEVDGVYGAKTESAIKQFQNKYGKTSDGEITSYQTTYKKLFSIDK